MSTTILNKLNNELTQLEKQLTQFKSAVSYLNSAQEVVGTAVQSVKAAEDYHAKKLGEIDIVYTRTKDIAKKVENLSSQIETVDFPNRLTTIDANLQKAVDGINIAADSTLAELKVASQAISTADFEGKFSSLSKLFDEQVAIMGETMVEVRRATEDYTKKIEGAVSKVGDNLDTGIKSQRKYIEELQLDAKLNKQINRLDEVEKSLATVQTLVEHCQRNVSQKAEQLSSQNTQYYDSLKQLIEKTQSETFMRLDEISKKQTTYFIILVIATIVVGAVLAIMSHH